MEKTKVLFVFFIIWTSLVSYNACFAQDDDCCEEYDPYGRDSLSEQQWQKQMDDLNARKIALGITLGALAKDIDGLNGTLADNNLLKAENDMYAAIGMDKAGLSDFRRKFDETEKKISNRAGTCADARKMYFDEIGGSKAKCLPEFDSRYITMKSKLEAWEKDGCGIAKTDQYIVVKGDCLWRIAGKKEIYNNSRFWPKLWEANENGVVSAPGKTPKKITNPNLIYPGQVIKVPVLSAADLSKLKDKTYIRGTQNKSDKFKKDNGTNNKVKTKDIKKDTKAPPKETKKDDKKNKTPDVKK